MMRVMAISFGGTPYENKLRTSGLLLRFGKKDILELPAGYQKITCHMVFDVKMGKNFRIKSRFVSDWHNTKTPAAITYS